MILRRWAILGILGFLAGSLVPATARAADDDGAEAASREQARAALSRFRDDFSSRDPEDRARALRRLGRVAHPDVAARLLRELVRERDPALLAATLDALAGQTPTRDRVGKAVVKLVRKEAARKRELFERGDPGFLLEPGTNDCDEKTEKGRQALRDLAARDQMIAAAFRCLLALDYHEDLDAEAIEPMLQSAEDDLVLAALDATARYREWSLLPAVLVLFKMYPKENRWETGFALDLTSAGTAKTSKAKWMLIFGHPEKQKARPKVYAAILECVKTLTGTEVEDPADLKALMRRKDVKEKVEEAGKSRRR